MKQKHKVSVLYALQTRLPLHMLVQKIQEDSEDSEAVEESEEEERPRPKKKKRSTGRKDIENLRRMLATK